MSWLLLFLVVPLSVGAQSLSIERLTPHNGLLTSVTYKGRPAVRVVEDPKTPGNALAILKDSAFHDGVIEIELSGSPTAGAGAGARGFVGVAFRLSPDASKYECIYLRPTNGRADDQLRRNHSVQYISHPEYPWERLRKENPSQYETYTDLVPGEWTKVKIEVKGNKARLWVNGSDQPTMLVNDLKLGDAQGPIALWIGPGTEGHFTGLKITK